MTLVRYSPNWDPFEEMAELMRGSHSRSYMPAMDMYEEKDSIVVKTPLAGINPDNVQVSVEKGVVTIQGESKKEHEVDDKNYYRKEIRGGSFFRQVVLPTAVKEKDVKAEFEDGVLKITCPKKEEEKAKQINVKIIKKSNKK